TLRGHIAVGHCRYSTTGSPTWENAQPTFRSTEAGGLALAHNGNLINTPELAARLEPGVLTATTDTEVLTALLAAHGTAADGDPLAAVRQILPDARGAYSLVFMGEQTLYAARDPEGVRPLVLGRLEDVGGWVVASETAALDIVGAAFVRE